MEERYWLRHPSLDGHQGPFAVKDLQAAIESEAFPADSYVLRDQGQNQQDRQTSIAWIPIAQLLGFDEPAPAPPSTTPPALPTNADRRRHLRTHTAYGFARGLVVGFLVVGVVLALATAATSARHLSGSVACASVVMASAIQVGAVLLVGMLMQALLDIADRAVQTAEAPERAPPPPQQP